MLSCLVARRACDRTAQGCRAAATLGKDNITSINPERVGSLSVLSETPLGLCDDAKSSPRVAATRQPTGEFDATASRTCTCDFCQGWRAANALQTAGSRSPDVASLDSDLELVTAVWGDLPVAIRQAILALIGANNRRPGNQLY